MINQFLFQRYADHRLLSVMGFECWNQAACIFFSVWFIHIQNWISQANKSFENV